MFTAAQAEVNGKAMEGSLVSGGDQVYQAADGIVADVPEINQQTVRQAIDVMVEVYSTAGATTLL